VIDGVVLFQQDPLLQADSCQVRLSLLRSQLDDGLNNEKCRGGGMIQYQLPPRIVESCTYHQPTTNNWLPAEGHRVFGPPAWCGVSSASPRCPKTVLRRLPLTLRAKRVLRQDQREGFEPPRAKPYSKHPLFPRDRLYFNCFIGKVNLLGLLG